jgi:hypothetical protein
VHTRAVNMESVRRALRKLKDDLAVTTAPTPTGAKSSPADQRAADQCATDQRAADQRAADLPAPAAAAAPPLPPPPPPPHVARSPFLLIRWLKVLRWRRRSVVCVSCVSCVLDPPSNNNNNDHNKSCACTTQVEFKSARPPTSSSPTQAQPVELSTSLPSHHYSTFLSSCVLHATLPGFNLTCCSLVCTEPHTPTLRDGHWRRSKKSSAALEKEQELG